MRGRAVESDVKRPVSFTDHYCRRLMEAGIGRPVKVSVDVTSRCNLNCSYCYEPHDHEDDLQLSLLGSALTSAVSMGCLEVTISGGEPCLHPDFVDIIRLVKQLQVRVWILTNGSLPGRVLSIIPYLTERDTVQISVDSMTDYECRKGALQALQTAEMIIGFRPRVEVNIVANRFSQSGLTALVEHLTSLHLSCISLSFVVPFGPSQLRMMLSAQDKYALDREVRKICAQTGTQYISGLYTDVVAMTSLQVTRDTLRANAPGDDPPGLEALWCEAGRVKCHIASTGEVFPCVYLMHPDVSMGNLRSSSLKSIWANSARHSRDLNNTRCSRCEFVRQCKGGCPGVALALTGTYNEADPRCEYR